MLNPNNDRLDYGQILAPPADYTLDFAVGTTYSLDLDALVGASLAMGLSEETDSALMNNPVCLLEALRSTGDKVALFSEGGQIHTPNNVTSLYILLEKMVFSVKTAKHRGISAYPSFHPKFWLLRFKNHNGQLKYRVVILSRNLTFDRSWDITYFMDGERIESDSAKNQPLCDFLHYLLGFLPSNENGKTKAKGIKSLIKELPFVSFSVEKEFYDYEFIPVGVKKAEGGFYQITDKPLFTDTFHELLIISPFLTGSVLREFNNRNIRSFIESPKYLLITREMSLGKLKPEDVSRFKIFTMRDTVIDGETAISEKAFDAQKQDIHAKVYMMRKYSDTDLYLGSLNASHNAIHGNIEFMLLLRTKNRYLNIDKLTADLFGTAKDGSDNPFQEISLQNAIIDEDDIQKNALDSIVKAINRSGPTASAIAQGEGLYSIRIHFDMIDTRGFKVEIWPLLSKKTAEYDSDILFDGLQITQLSEFYSITVSDSVNTTERVLIIPTSELPEDREKAVITSVVCDKECFYRYIAFLLGDNSILGAVEGNTVFNEGISSRARQSFQIPALYEKMLKTAANTPEKFKGIEYLMKTISEDGVIPEDFKELYETFKKVVKIRV